MHGVCTGEGRGGAEIVFGFFQSFTRTRIAVDLIGTVEFFRTISRLLALQIFLILLPRFRSGSIQKQWILGYSNHSSSSHMSSIHPTPGVCLESVGVGVVWSSVHSKFQILITITITHIPCIPSYTITITIQYLPPIQPNGKRASRRSPRCHEVRRPVAFLSR